MTPFVGGAVTLSSAIGPLLFGIVDADHPGIAEGVSRLLVRSIQDARADRGGHLPEWLVDDIERNYISPQKVRTLWAPSGHRFAVFRPAADGEPGELIATIHIARDADMILTVDRHRLNVRAAEYPGFKPDRYHHVVNVSVKHELRRARIAMAMLDGIVEHFRDRFAGDGLWVRADPPWHPGLVGLGFVHDPSLDVFLPPDAERTAGLSHAEFNLRYACDCRPAAPARPDVLAERARAMQERKLQYVSLSRAFDAAPARATRNAQRGTAPDLRTDALARERCSEDWGRVQRLTPRAVATPARCEDVARILASAQQEGTRVTVRGAGQSAGGQALGGDVILSTERLDRIHEVDRSASRVRVEAGVRWSALIERLAPEALLPPVVPGWPSATVGGVLASGGIGKGSHARGLVADHVAELVVVTGDGRQVACSRTQAAWLFEAVLGGLGCFGVIVEATLALVPWPSSVRVERLAVGPDPARLQAELEASSADPAYVHVTAFADEGGGWSVVRARAGDAGPGVDTATAYAGRRPIDDEDYVRIAAYLAPRRPEVPPSPALWLHQFLPARGLGSFLERSTALARSAGDAVQVVPVRSLRLRHGSLLQSVDVPDGELVYLVCLTRELRGRAVDTVVGENEGLLAFARTCGGRSALQGTLPRDEAGWREHLGAHCNEVLEAKRIADPRGVLGVFRDLG